MAVINRNTGRLALAAGVLAALAGPALAQMEGFDKPLNERPERVERRVQPAQAGVQSFTRVSKIEGDQSYELEISDGQVRAKVNGREVPADRIQREGDRYDILDRRGNVLTSFRVVQPRLDDGLRMAPRVAPPRGIAPPPPPAPAPAPEIPAPRVMIGITMNEEIPEPLLDHLGLEPSTAVLVDRVIEGLPAERAGLRPRDVIVEVDGQRPLTSQRIRELINRKDPGEKVNVKVIRRGQERAIQIELEAFDPERLRAEIPGADDAGREMNEAQRGVEEARRLMDEALRRFQGDAELMERLQPLERFRQHDMDPEQVQRWRDAARERAQRAPQVGIMPEGFDIFVPMAPGQQRDSGTREKLNQLDERMADLERQMERLAERMDELRRALERREEPRRRE
jgi:hypothetical protein